MNLKSFRAGLALAALAAAACATPAQAANVSLQNGVATFTAGAATDNNLKIKPHPNAVLFEDAEETVSPGVGCEAVNPNAVKCGTFGLNSIRAVVGVGDNSVLVTADYPTVVDGQGADKNRFWGGPGTDVLIGGNYDDMLSGGSGADDLNGGAGEDRLFGGPGNDELYGQGNGDYLVGEAGADLFDGGVGYDVVDYTGRSTRVVVTIDNVANDGTPLLEGDDVRTTNEAVIGGGANDELTGTDNPDTLAGGPGDDVIRGGGGPDHLEGEAGSDTASYSDRTAPVHADLDPSSGDGEEGEHDGLLDFENIEGGRGDDTLIGNASANLLRGGDGNDSIDGLGGQDDLFGEEGDDTLRSEDGEADDDDCGLGIDTAFADAADSKANCELPVAEKPVDPPAEQPVETPAKPAAIVVTPKKPRADRRGYAKLKLSCPATATGRCKGTLRLRRGARTYGSVRYSVAAGSTKTVRVKVKRNLRRTLGSKRMKIAIG